MTCESYANQECSKDKSCLVIPRGVTGGRCESLGCCLHVFTHTDNHEHISNAFSYRYKYFLTSFVYLDTLSPLVYLYPSRNQYSLLTPILFCITYSFTMSSAQASYGRLPCWSREEQMGEVIKAMYVSPKSYWLVTDF